MDAMASNARRNVAGRIQVALIGCNHRTAAVDLRERISFTQQQALDAADELRKQGILEEAVVLSTCNRSELYGVPGEGGAALTETMEQFFTSFHGVSRADLDGKFYRWEEVHEVGIQRDFRTVLTFFRPNNKIYWTFGDSELADLNSDDYAVDAAELAALLNDGVRRATGRSRKVCEGPKFPGQLLRPTVFYIRNYLFLVAVALWLALRLLPYYR